MKLKLALKIAKDTFSDWSEDKALRLAAAMAYYTTFSLAPLLTIVIAIAGLAFGQEAARGQIVAQIRGLVGDQGAQAIQTIAANANSSGGSMLATILGIAVLIFGATGMFVQLQDALNTIWEVKPKPGRGIIGAIKDRFFSFAMVIGMGFLLIASLAVSAGLAALGSYASGIVHGHDLILQAGNFLISFIVITFIFALTFKFVPDADIAWGDVWIGAAITSLLFNIGKFLMGVYLGHSSVGSAYGAAGSLIILLLWIYYSANILLLGAEFTQVYANNLGSRIVPKKDAVPATAEMKAQQGLGHIKKGSEKPADASSEGRHSKGSHHADHSLLGRAISGVFYLRSLWKRF